MRFTSIQLKNTLKILKTIKNNTMKTLHFISAVILFFVYSCNSDIKTNGHKVTFGIYEVVKRNELPNAVIDSLKTKKVQLEVNLKSEIGYITEADSLALKLDLSGQTFKLVKTNYPINKEKKYYAVVAIRPNSIIDNTCIKKTKVNGNTVEIYFNYEGAKKWADLTKKSIGNQLAFVIDDQIYTLPTVSAEMKNGVAIINDFNSEVEAKNISESLNSFR
jgi:preprotein translocase subunit SecD